MKKSRLLLLSIILVAALLRFYSLGADPSILLDSGQVGDEGYWLYNARNLATFGQTAKDNFYHDFAAAPVFSFAAYLSFLIFKTGFWQARLVSAIAGLITVFMTYKIAKRISLEVALLSTLLVSINTMLLLHNRLAVGESLSIMFATLGFFFLMSAKRESLSGAAFAFSILSKTTSFLYLPSAGLLLLSNLRQREQTVKNIIRFSVPFLGLLFFIFGTLYIKWGRQINQIYSTFGTWLAPRTFGDIWQNALNFFQHPFWGSPFLFSLLLLAIINAFNFITDTKSRTHERKFLLLWFAGIFILGPFVARLSNARILGLVVPIAVLGSQTVIDRRIRKIDLKKLSNILGLGKLIYASVALVASIPIGLILAKLILAIVKRATLDPTVVYKLPYYAVLIILVLWIVAFKKRIFLEKILLFDVYLLMFLPLASFIPLFWSYLGFFNLTSGPSSTSVSIITAFSFFLFYFFMKKQSRVNSVVIPLLAVYIFFNIAGITTVLYRPTYNIQNASLELGQIIGNNSLIGFYAHELAVGNKSWPIYWAPNLNNVGEVNSNFRIYNPRFLLVTQTFDSLPGSLEAWPNEKSVNGRVSYITTLDLSRSFWKAKREFKIDVYKIVN